MAVGDRRTYAAGMAGIVLRVRLTSGDHLDVTYEESGSSDDDEVIKHALAALADNAGMLRCRHGDRLIVLYARGVAAVEIAPRGAVL
jgi:hypothetical protein